MGSIGGMFYLSLGKLVSTWALVGLAGRTEILKFGRTDIELLNDRLNTGHTLI